MKRIVLLLMLLISIGMKAQSPIPDGYYSVELFRVIINDKDVITEPVNNTQCFATVNDGSMFVVYMMNYPAISCNMSEWVKGENGTTYFTATEVHTGFKSTSGINALEDGKTFHVVIGRGNGRSDVFTIKKIEVNQ